jgi:hypothetical protein
MKKILLIILMTLSLKAYFIEDLEYYKITNIMVCINENRDEQINKKFYDLENFLVKKEEIRKVKELKALWRNTYKERFRNFPKYLKGLKKIEKIYLKKDLEKKYNMEHSFTEALFYENYYNMTSFKNLAKERKKMELLKIVIQPLLELDNETITNCMPSS